jgi:poly-beta-hydroxyalkanoate depolymerase
MLPEHEVFITDWQDARMVPLSAGRFDLDDYIDYVVDMLRHLGPGAHVIAVVSAFRARCSRPSRSCRGSRPRPAGDHDA